jgi:arachidonate 5-lipoxygenase
MITLVVAAWRRAQLWFWARFFILLVALGAGSRRRRMSHNNGIAGRGTIRIVDRPEFPPTDFFEPGREFPCRLRHASVAYMDDAMRAVRSATLKFADSDFRSPLDIQMNTGDYCFFWNARSFLQFAFSRHDEGGIEYERFYAKHWQGRISAASALLRSPPSFTGLHFHSHTPFAWKARDGRPRYARFRLIPEDRRRQAPYQDPAWIAQVEHQPEAARELADQRRLPEERRNNNYLKQEWAGRVRSGGARYILQVQLHEVSPDDSPEIRNPLRPWDEATHPNLDLAVVEITEVLGPQQSDWMAFEITNLPSSLAILPAASLDDYNSLNYMRRQSIWAIRARRLMLRLFGPNPVVPDDAPPNYNPKGM